MVKAFIESIEDNGYSYKIRIPIYHRIENTPGAVPKDQLPIAPVCTMPGVSPSYQVGDIVWVDFENDELGTPVIIGLLYSKKNSESTIDIKCSSISVDSDASLPDSTKIGNTKNSLNSLPQIKQNISEIDDILDVLMKEYQEKHTV